MYPELAHGATALLERWGDPELKQRFLPKLIDGTWGGTMCLTEPHAGTDLGIIRTKAVPAGDGAYHLTGTKIFISAGDHDLTENIVHLVLAKLPDAPPGTKGISLFLVPKFLPTEEGAVGTANGVSVGSIEHKMGIKGNSTCVLNFDGAKGWLVGEPHKGLRVMFTMMNGARLGVGMQGLGLAEVSYQNAVAYAKDRVQGRALTGAANPQGEADPIIVHPDVRRMLMTMRAYIEGMRALAYWVGLLIDVEDRHPDAARREEAADLVALMTPVIKAFLTDTGFEVTNLALQCYGGHGYIREFGMEQFVRDARIAQIYEGTNGVQAMDLIGRKVPEGNGRLVKRLLAIVQRDLAAAQGDPRLKDLATPLGDAVRALQQATMTVMGRAQQNPNEAGAVAAEYLRLFGLVATGWMWLKMSAVAHAKLAAAAESGAQLNGHGAHYEAKIKTARFYFAKLLPQVYALQAQIASGAAPVMELDAAAF
jgi:alkylation response protein AidB-like acyl-CoA dehydrogenase